MMEAMDDAERLTAANGSSFDRWPWFYSLCRERVFTDHTDKIAPLLDTCRENSEPRVFLEVGCGPGHYARTIAGRCPSWSVYGVDQSERLLEKAKSLAAKGGSRCSFVHADVFNLAGNVPQADFILASRLLLILADRRAAVRSMHSTLCSGGNLLICEPLASWRTRLPALCLRVLDKLAGGATGDAGTEIHAMTFQDLRSVIDGLPWKSARLWTDDRYLYALCIRA